MNFRLKKIENISELIIGKTYMSFTRDISEAIEKHNINSSIPIKVIKKIKSDVVEIQIDSNNSIVTQDMLNKYMNIYSIQIVDSNDSETTDKEVISLKRQIKKLEKKNAILDKIIRKNGIELIQHKQLKKQKKKEKPMVVKDIFTDSIFGYQAYVVIKTNNIDKVQVSLTIQPGVNLINDTVVQHKMIVNGIAIKHKDDNFSYELGKQLAYSRAINELMERILQDYC